MAHDGRSCRDGYVHIPGTPSPFLMPVSTCDLLPWRRGAARSCYVALPPTAAAAGAGIASLSRLPFLQPSLQGFPRRNLRNSCLYPSLGIAVVYHIPSPVRLIAAFSGRAACSDGLQLHHPSSCRFARHLHSIQHSGQRDPGRVELVEAPVDTPKELPHGPNAVAPYESFHQCQPCLLPPNSHFLL